MKLSLCNTGLRKPLSTRHTTPRPTHTYTQKSESESESLSYISPATNSSTTTAACGSCAALWRPRHSILSFLRSSQQPNTTTHSAVYPPPPLRMAQYCGHTKTKSNQPAPRRSRLFAPSPLTTPSLVSLALNQVCHIRLFPFALRVFSMKWSNRLSVFSFAPFRSSTLSLDSVACCCFCVCPSSFQKNIV